MTAVAAVALLCPALTPAQEWTRFRGPNGSGVSETTIPVRWDEQDLDWKTALPGVGHSSPVLWGRKLFVTCGENDSGRRTLCCLDAVSGRIEWTRDYDTATHHKHQLNSFASSMPCVDSQRVYLRS